MNADSIPLASSQPDRDVTDLIATALEAKPAAEAPDREWSQYVRTLEVLERDALDRIETMLTELSTRLGQIRGMGAPPQPHAFARRESCMVRAEMLASRLVILWDGYEELDALRRQLATRCADGDAGLPDLQGNAEG